MTLVSEVRKIKGNRTFVPATEVWDQIELNPGQFKHLEKISSTHSPPRRNQVVTRKLKQAGWTRTGCKNATPLWEEPCRTR